MGKLTASVELLFAGTAWVMLATGVASAADLQVKAPALAPAPAWLADTPPMFGDLLLVDSPLIRLDTPVNVIRGTFKIAENESPRPTDRVFFNYNYYNQVDVGSGKVDLNRETIGFEKTFLDGNFSFGMRIPYVQNFDHQSDVGDLTLILKYAFINDRASGSVVSAGLAVTLPTGQNPIGFDLTNNTAIHPAVLQPYVSAIWTQGNFFVQGFSSVAVPTDSNDTTYLFNDIGAGIWLYRAGPGQFISAVIPTLELHVNSPLDHLDAGTPQPMQTIVNLTGGAHIQIFGQSMFGVALSTPLTSPRPYDLEAIVNFNTRF